MKIAVIGSRETADAYNRLLFGLVSVWLLEHEVRSGLCKRGPDSVVTRLCEILHRDSYFQRSSSTFKRAI